MSDAKKKLQELYSLLDTHIINIENWLKAYEDCDGFRRHIKILMTNKLFYIKSLQEIITEDLKEI